MGDEAKYFEDQFGNNEDTYESEMVKRVMLSLRNMFGKNIPNPVKVYVTKWGKDPFSKGPYSYNKVKMQKKVRSSLGKSVKGRVYFAGEATSELYFSTTHRVYLSGK